MTLVTHVFKKRPVAEGAFKLPVISYDLESKQYFIGTKGTTPISVEDLHASHQQGEILELVPSKELLQDEAIWLTPNGEVFIGDKDNLYDDKREKVGDYKFNNYDGSIAKTTGSIA